MKTSDVYLAAALLSLNYKLESVDRKDPRHMVFVFSETKSNLGQVQEKVDEQNLNTIETQWANESLNGNLFRMAEAVKRMKSLIHSGS